MAGDFSPSSTGSVPQLRATGVTAGSYGPASIVVDAKGRIIFAKQITWEQLQNFFPTASTTEKGFMQVGGNLTVNDGVISIPKATPQVLGVVQAGENMSINGSGVLSFSVPHATTTTYGVVKWGGGTWVNGSGNLQQWWWKNARAWNGTPGDFSNAGMVKVNTNPDSGLEVGDGILSGRIANADFHGQVKIKDSGNRSFYIPADGEVNIHRANFNLTGIVYPNYLDPDYFSISPEGEMSLDISAISIPTASDTVLGGVKVGSGLAINAEGVLSNETLQPATTSSLGAVQLAENGGFQMSGDFIQSADASATTKGIIQLGSTGFLTTAIAGFQDYVGLRFWRASATNPGVMRGSADAGGDVNIINGDIFFTDNIPRLNTANTYTKSLVTSLVQLNKINRVAIVTPDFSASNSFDIDVVDNGTIANPTNVVAGEVVQIVIKKSLSENTFTLGSHFKLNEDLNNNFPSSQVLVLSCICISASEILTIQKLINL